MVGWLVGCVNRPCGARQDILVDFFRSAFDGSGADNFYDAGSCIDGRWGEGGGGGGEACRSRGFVKRRSGRADHGSGQRAASRPDAGAMASRQRADSTPPPPPPPGSAGRLAGGGGRGGGHHRGAAAPPTPPEPAQHPSHPPSLAPLPPRPYSDSTSISITASVSVSLSGSVPPPPVGFPWGSGFPGGQGGASGW